MASRVKIKPLSVNKVWQGKRFKTKDYKMYEQELLYKLPQLDIPDGELVVEIEWGVSSKLSDVDNPIKPFLDVLQLKYGFNDRNIYKLVVKKALVKRNMEYILFDIKNIEV